MKSLILTSLMKKEGGIRVTEACSSVGEFVFPRFENQNLFKGFSHCQGRRPLWCPLSRVSALPRIRDFVAVILPYSSISVRVERDVCLCVVSEWGRQYISNTQVLRPKGITSGCDWDNCASPKDFPLWTQIQWKSSTVVETAVWSQESSLPISLRNRSKFYLQDSVKSDVGIWQSHA